MPVVILLAIGGLAPAARATEPVANQPSVTEALTNLAKALEADDGLKPETKEALTSLVEALQSERARNESSQAIDAPSTDRADAGAAAALPPPATDRWSRFLENIKVYGDARLRYESDFVRTDQEDRNRERIRLRLGANYRLDEEWSVGARLVTGDADDPNSPHVTIGDLFNNLEVSLDQAFVTYRPARFPDLWVTAGKFAHPFRTNPVYGELLWDADVQPEGISAGYTWPEVGALGRVSLVAGEYVTVEQNTLDEGSAFVAQLSQQSAPSDMLTFFSALSVYRFTDLTPDGNNLFVQDNSSNAVFAGEFVSRFCIFDAIASMTYKGLDRPLTFSGEYIYNHRAAHGQGIGWAGGVAYGETRHPGDVKLYYQYQEIAQDAVVSALAQDDFPLTSGFRGHVFGVNYMFTKNVGLNTWFLASERQSASTAFANDDGADEWRFRVDLNLKF
jgi:hypothetical protein